MSSALKIRIAHGKNTAMGPGKADLLQAIIDTGSISAAAKRMNMSYKRAWQLVDDMNSCFQRPLVETAMGGVHGGGATITDFGLEILATYRALIAKTESAASEELAKINAHLVSL